VVENEVLQQENFVLLVLGMIHNHQALSNHHHRADLHLMTTFSLI
jgi:hypothetical protein